MTKSVERLEADALVTRRAHPTDRLTTLAAITRQGRTLVEATTSLLGDRKYGMIGRSPAELRRLTLITRLRSANGDFIDGSRR